MNLSRLPAVRREQAPDAPAIADDVHHLSNAAFDDLIDAYARHFAGRGVGRGDIVIHSGYL